MTDVDCATCGCPEDECLDLDSVARRAGERDECCSDCTHVYVRVSLSATTTDEPAPSLVGPKGQETT